MYTRVHTDVNHVKSNIDPVDPALKSIVLFPECSAQFPRQSWHFPRNGIFPNSDVENCPASSLDGGTLFARANFPAIFANLPKCEVRAL